MSATAHAHEIADVARAVGFVTPGVTVQIVDQSGTILPAGQEGHVRVMSEYAVDRYFRNPKASAGVFRDGWFYPGDLGQFTSEGLLVITGREQAVLNLGGDKLNPEKVELVLLQFKGVIEAAVFGLPNEYGNNEVCAAVASRDKLDEQALRAHCEALVPRGFAPVRFIFADSLPHNDMGKVDRRRLLDLIPKR